MEVAKGEVCSLLSHLRCMLEGECVVKNSRKPTQLRILWSAMEYYPDSKFSFVRTPFSCIMLTLLYKERILKLYFEDLSPFRKKPTCLPLGSLPPTSCGCGASDWSQLETQLDTCPHQNHVPVFCSNVIPLGNRSALYQSTSKLHQEVPGPSLFSIFM